jgi:hypothetical protein
MLLRNSEVNSGRVVSEGVQLRLNGGRHCARCGESGGRKGRIFEGISASDSWTKTIQRSREEMNRFHQVLDKSEVSMEEEREWL